MGTGTGHAKRISEREVDPLFSHWQSTRKRRPVVGVGGCNAMQSP